MLGKINLLCIDVSISCMKLVKDMNRNQVERVALVLDISLRFIYFEFFLYEPKRKMPNQHDLFLQAIRK